MGKMRNSSPDSTITDVDETAPLAEERAYLANAVGSLLESIASIFTHSNASAICWAVSYTYFVIREELRRSGSRQKRMVTGLCTSLTESLKASERVKMSLSVISV